MIAHKLFVGRLRFDLDLRVGVGLGLLFLFLVLISVKDAWCDLPLGLMQNFKGGQINWADGSITGHGTFTPQAKEEQTQSVVDRQKTILGAKVAAQKNLLDIIESLPILSGQTISQMLITKKKIAKQLQEFVRGAEVISQSFGSDGTVKVTLGMPITGGLLQLVLPENIHQIEPIITIPDTKTTPLPSMPVPLKEKDHYSGLIVDARGIGFQPALVMMVRDELGQELYGPAMVSREFVVLQGMAQLHLDLAAAKLDKRVIPRPLVVKGLSTVAGRPTEIIISNSDAQRLQGAFEHLSFLRKCMVAIVIDPLPQPEVLNQAPNQPKPKK